ncbi:MAG: translation initiation factor IF-3 [Candidatus Riflebacteria bacterium RBG_13_59_9]|nr:MAG: translation initiation factor IF-3 [Candidatus Riflebacteria bacterium RBG_13_59_9]
MRRRPSGRKKLDRGPRANRQIRAVEVRLIDDSGENVGVVSLSEALSLTWEKGLDLVEVGPNENPPVCKMIDFGKLKYRERKKRASAKQGGGGGELKEIGLSLKIGDHDFDVKIARAKKFIQRGFKVKFNLLLRGREKAFQDTLGQQLLDRVTEMMFDVGAVDSRSRGLVGNRLFVIISPSKRKATKEGAKKDAEGKGQNAQGNRQAGSPDQEREAPAAAGRLAPPAAEEVIPPEA